MMMFCLCFIFKERMEESRIDTQTGDSDSVDVWLRASSSKLAHCFTVLSAVNFLWMYPQAILKAKMKATEIAVSSSH